MLIDKYGQSTEITECIDIGVSSSFSDKILIYMYENDKGVILYACSDDETKLISEFIINISKRLDEKIAYASQRVSSELLLNVKDSATKGQSSLNESDALRQWDELLLHGNSVKASDLHINVEPNNSYVKFRVDGELKLWGGDKNHVTLDSMLSQVYSVAGSDDGEITGTGFQPLDKQDAQIFRTNNGMRLGVRWASITKTGSKDNYSVKCRLLGDQNEKSTKMPFDQIGFIRNQISSIKNNLRGKGLILILGETNSGKSRTLENLLMEIRDQTAGTESIYSFENPIERIIDGIEQYSLSSKGQISEEIKLKKMKDMMAFFMRADPNTLSVAEIRDLVSVLAAQDLAKSGHNVFATLHVESPFEVPDRLIALGANEKIVTKGLVRTAIAQKLFKRLCNCSKSIKEVELTEDIYNVCKDFSYMGLSNIIPHLRFRNEIGCPECNPNKDKGIFGLKGMALAAEVMVYNKDITDALLADDLKSAEKLWLGAGNITKLDAAIYNAARGRIDPRDIVKEFGYVTTSFNRREAFGLPHFKPLLG